MVKGFHHLTSRILRTRPRHRTEKNPGCAYFLSYHTEIKWSGEVKSILDMEKNARGKQHLTIVKGRVWKRYLILSATLYFFHSLFQFSCVHVSVASPRVRGRKKMTAGHKRLGRNFLLWKLRMGLVKRTKSKSASPSKKQNTSFCIFKEWLEHLSDQKIGTQI